MEKSNDITKKREANIELLRIVAMLMVISLHCVGNGRLLSNSQVSLPNLIGIRLIDSLSLVAVSAFFIVSGYYMINKSMSLKKIFCLWGKVIFYSLLLYLICSLINHKTEIYPTFFPVLSGQY